MDLESAIKRTLAFFAVWQQPLTPMEVWRYLWLPQYETCSMKHVALIEVKKKLEEMTGWGELGVAHQFYFLLKNPEGQSVYGKTWYLERQWLGIVSLKKWRLAVRGARLLCLVPFVRMVAVGNTLAIEHAREDSDIDFFIIAKTGRLWTVRLISLLLLQLAGLRRHGRHIQDRLCLSFYATEEALDLSTLAKPSLDPYLAYWVASLWPVYGKETYKKFWQANFWIKQFLPTVFARETNGPRRVDESWFSKSWRIGFECILDGVLGNALEKFCRLIMLRRIYSHSNSRLQRQETDVVVSDRILKFHETDRRIKIREEWEEWFRVNQARQVNQVKQAIK